MDRAEGSAYTADDSAVPIDGVESGGHPVGVLAIVGVIASQVVLITAVLYYFGWVRTYTFLSYFGVDPSMAGYSTADYVLRSIKVAFPPLIRASLTFLVLFGVHRSMVMPTLERAEPGFIPPPPSAAQTVAGSALSVPKRSAVVRALRWARALTLRWRPGHCGIRWLLFVVHVAGVALAMVVLTGILLPAQIGVALGLWLPLMLIAAVTMLGYVTYLRSRYPASLSTAGSWHAAPSSRTYTLTLLTLGLISTLWAVGLYGNQVGIDTATDMVDHLPDQPGVTIYSIDRMAIAGPGVIVAEITEPGAKYHYQYSGLRLLLHSPDRYLLLPKGWRHGQDRVFLVHDDDTIRIDITAP